ncbi:uroporphyrinogen-III C-methyltransferase [Kovacikia minuta CCNUW1]|uniref:uroporphyrinogen-III C-methyltransferase n=1 Tax=Kovacikia minuta TaxID=2931930 RepID=UPI001CC99D22|nr:uroporphyrinogen-III C-methyltransferase [Kovacikia minuta]UBF25457.1 uroporphyrinogen-III C-methyltransferase [Kovacikia minuta CCNUW1]
MGNEAKLVRERTGIVYLVGSGPGNVSYLTVRGYQLLTQAEVLVYDALVDSELLSLVPAHCLQLDVGKRGGEPSMAQAEINRLLVQHCQQGYQVVRLKSGDPFIFGRAQAEIQALKAAGCAYEVVPGISSALVAPLLAGIPLTDPALSRCFAIVTGHEPDALNWEALAQLETLVILMGGRQLPEIVYQLRQHGRSPLTAIAIIRWAGRSHQRIWEGTLADIVERTTSESLSPCVIVIGEVVGFRTYLQTKATGNNRDPNSVFLKSSTSHLNMPTVSYPSHSLIPGSQSLTPDPLSGKTILVTRSVSQSSQFSDRLRQEGATVVEMPTLEIVPPSNWEGLDQAIAHLSEFNWLVLTSANSVDYFFERLATQVRDVRALAGLKIAVVGDKTAQMLEKRGLKPDFVPPEFVADSLAAYFPKPLQGTKILFPRVESGGRDVLVKDFANRGAEVTEVAAYQSRCPETIAPGALEAFQNCTVDVITFASSKTVKHFCYLLQQAQGDDSWQTWLDEVCIASIGPQTSKTCESLLGRVDVEAQEYTLEGLVQAIVGWFEANDS